MPLDGAFSLQSCALAYAFAQTVLFGMAKINISVICQLPCVHNPWISTFFSVLPAPCAPLQEPCNRCSCVGDGDGNVILLKLTDIGIATVLDSTVGMMDEARKRISATHLYSLVNGHL